MKYPRLDKHIPKIIAVVAASLALPGLALAGKGNDDNNGKHYGQTKNGDPSVSSVPEANPGIVLIPFVGAVLLFSTLYLVRRNAPKNAPL